MVQKILIGIVGAVAFAGIALVAIFMMQPSEVVQEHSVVVDASPDEAFAHVEDLRTWQQWAPIAGPDTETTLGETDRGEDATLEWSGDEDAGAGQVTIVDTRPDESVELEMELREPVQSTHTSTFTFEPVDEGSRVTWTTRTEMSAPMRVFIPEDSLAMIDLDYREGLDELAAVVESGG